MSTQATFASCSRVIARSTAPTPSACAQARRSICSSSARRLSYYPPPEPFFSPQPGSKSTSQFSSSLLSSEAAEGGDTSALSTFGADGELLTGFLARPPTALTLRSLLALGGSPGSRPSTHHILTSARFTASELPVRLARRVDAFRGLPFIVGSNPHIQKVARLYAGSFQAIAGVGRIKDDADNERFTRALEQMVEDHAENIPTLARGE